jgi:hypothetical protein
MRCKKLLHARQHQFATDKTGDVIAAWHHEEPRSWKLSLRALASLGSTSPTNNRQGTALSTGRTSAVIDGRSKAGTAFSASKSLASYLARSAGVAAKS